MNDPYNTRDYEAMEIIAQILASDISAARQLAQIFAVVQESGRFSE